MVTAQSIAHPPAQPTRFRHARLYITFRCNARCGYCNVWQDPVFFGHDELGPDDLRRCLDQIRELGVEYIDVTGGEPALHRNLAVAVRHARQIGLHVELTTNAIRFDGLADEILPDVSTLNISLDTLSAERYHAIRGTDTLARTVALIERLRGQGATNLKLIAVVTNQTRGDLDGLVRFAQQNQVPVYLSPMFEYFEGQGEVRDPTRTKRSLRLAEVNGRLVLGQTGSPATAGGTADDQGRLPRLVRAHVYTPYAIVSLDFLRLVETLDPSTSTACGAGSRILTIGPDGRLLLPCYHEWNSSLAWERPYVDLVEDREFLRVRDTEVGLRPGCRRCTVFPYLGLATSYRLTEGFLVQAVSSEINKLKAGLQGLGGLSAAADRHRRGALAALLRRLDHLRLRPGTHLDELYRFVAAPGRGVTTDLAAAPVAVEEVLADHAHEDCWRVQRTPHRLVRMLYADVLPALVALAGGGATGALDLARRSLDAQLALWEIWMDRLPPATSPGPSGRGGAELGRWCRQAGELLVAAGRRDALRSVAALSILTDVPAELIRRWGGLGGHPDELLLIKVASEGLAPARRAALASCFDSPLAVELTARRPGDRPRPSPGPARPVDFALAATGDSGELDALRALAWQQCLAGDTPALRTLVRTWKRTTGGDPAHLERMLLAAELARLGPSTGGAR